ncbi:GntR family transcriptional regulator [Paenibacillus sp. 32O-W]|uniref:extracellular solute-binding protein n=1 Tax=Paenibacillus sp. 32O-W TaxID=1695218 RepID=UPI000721D989|nr:extracellular solute-binding protein [Paenibacillus sp. 32O-W]ALS27104.1 GntR family transcriptional regulator [Paenibacillus sp. 32O-W]
MKRENEFRYSKLANILREQILSGYIKPGQFLMSENDLCRHYGISRTSVRKSLDQLMKEGLIVKKVGQGTIVSPDLVIPNTKNKVLRIFATSPSHFYEHCMPIIIEQFERENPNVEVKCLGFSSAEFWESVQASMDLGLQPDILLTTDRHFDEIGSDIDFIDLKEHLADSYEMLYPRLKTPFLRDGKLKGAIATFSPVYLAYNPQLFRKHQVPEPSELWTTEEFLQAAKRLTMDTNGDGIDDQYGLTLSSSLGRWPVIALQNGADFKATSGKAPLVKTLNLIHDLLYRYRVATLSPRSMLNSEAYVKGKAAMIMTTSIEMAGWNNVMPGFESKVASLPFGERMGTLLIANVWMIPSASNETELAVRFLQKALSPEIQEKLGKAAGFMSALRPINEKTWDKSMLQSLYMNEDITEHSYFLYELFGDFSLADDMESEMQLFWAGLESADEVADRLLAMMSERS